MKVSAISPYNYYTSGSRQDYSPSFEGNWQTKITTSKIFTKKNIFHLTAIAVLSSLSLELIEAHNIDTPEIFNKISKILLGVSFIMSERPNKLDENIKFEKAETIEEAKEFAQKKLGIKNFDVDELDYANWVNEGLVNISNKFKGNVYFPQTIKLEKNSRLKGYAGQSTTKDAIVVNKKVVEECDELLSLFLRHYNYDELTKYNFGKGYWEFCDNLQREFTNKDPLDKFEKLALFKSILKVKEITEQLEEKGIKPNSLKDIDQYGNVYSDKFDTIYHEIGHSFDTKSGSLIRAIVNDFKYRKELEKLILPEYSKTNILEFIACTFSGIVQGVKYSPEVMELYNKITRFKTPI